MTWPVPFDDSARIILNCWPTVKRLISILLVWAAAAAGCGSPARPARGLVRVEGLLAQVRLRIGDQTLTAVITRDAVEELKLRRGDEALAIVKSTEVMIAREATAPSVDRPKRNRLR